MEYLWYHNRYIWNNWQSSEKLLNCKSISYGKLFLYLNFIWRRHILRIAVRTISKIHLHTLCQWHCLVRSTKYPKMFVQPVQSRTHRETWGHLRCALAFHPYYITENHIVYYKNWSFHFEMWGEHQFTILQNIGKYDRKRLFT